LSSGIRQAEQLRRQRAIQGAGVGFLVVAVTFLVLGLLQGVWSVALVALSACALIAALIAAARRGHVLVAAYGLSHLAIVAVVAGALARGSPSYSPFFVLLGLLVAAVTLPPRGVAIVALSGLFGELLLAQWPWPRRDAESMASVFGEGSLLFAVTAGIAVLTAASVARLVADLRKRDQEAHEAAERAEVLALELEKAQRMESLGRLAGGVAHDFNNLLTVMRGCATLLESAVPANTEAATDLKDLSDAVDRGTALTHQLLAFSKRDVVQPGVHDLHGAVEGMRDLLQRLLGVDMQLRIEAQDGPWPVWASLTQLEQVLMNLVVNARDAMGGKGELRVRIERVRDPQLGDVCRVHVADQGAGMSREVQARIFEPFFSTKGPVYGIVSRLGGRIDVDSVVGQGSTFTVSLPVATASAASDAAVPPPVSAAEAVAVCVVDDEPPLRNQMARILGGAGMVVHTYANAEALLAEGDHPCDVLVADVNLPGESGVDLARDLRWCSCRASRPILRRRRA
jgi:signal transduction histidine kinase